MSQGFGLSYGVIKRDFRQRKIFIFVENQF